MLNKWIIQKIKDEAYLNIFQVEENDMLFIGIAEHEEAVKIADTHNLAITKINIEITSMEEELYP